MKVFSDNSHYSKDMEDLFHTVIENVTGLIMEQADRTKAENQYPISVSQTRST